MKDVYLEQLYTFGKTDRDPSGRVVSVAYLALIPASEMDLMMVADTGWFPINRLPKLAYDHAEIIDVAVDRLRAKLTYTNISYGLLPEAFTLNDLQKTYEIILGKKLDKRNFRKKITSLNVLQQTGNKTFGKAHRPANLYRFTERTPRVAQIL
jgi:8-oxo-dGTP diphosphatase